MKEVRWSDGKVTGYHEVDWRSYSAESGEIWRNGK